MIKEIVSAFPITNNIEQISTLTNKDKMKYPKLIKSDVLNAIDELNLKMS